MKVVDSGKKYMIFAFVLCSFLPACWFKRSSLEMCPLIKDVNDVVALFPTTTCQIDDRVKAVIQKTDQALQAIINLPCEQRTFENTMRALDRASASLAQEIGIFSAVLNVYPQEEMRNAAQAAVIKLAEYAIDALGQNKKLYESVKEYAQRAACQQLDRREQYFITETLKAFERNGVNLPNAERGLVVRLQKELNNVGQLFEKNVRDDIKQFDIDERLLKGVDPEFIKSLPRVEKNGVVFRTLDTSYPTKTAVLENAESEETRKKMWTMFVNRAYPANEEVLKKLVALREELAAKLHYPSYTHYDLADEMAKTPETVERFFDEIEKRSVKKALAEIERYRNHLPEGVTLTSDGKIKAWDLEFIKTAYRKKYLHFDENVVSEYFPVDTTIGALLKIYEEFLGVKLNFIQAPSLWSNELRAIEMRNASGELIGYIVLDLFPRPHKFTHACQMTLAPVWRMPNNQLCPGVSLVIANFQKPVGDRPSLLRYDEMVTFFHEFGHVMHAMLGATEIISFSGTNVKHDFVEMPSQMFEEWMRQPEIIKRISHHYKTGLPLPEDIISVLVKLNHFDAGDFTRRQLVFAKTALASFKNGGKSDVESISRSFQHDLRPYLVRSADDHFEAAFEHLVSYGAKYYSYLWSKVYALDLFAQVKQHGLFDHAIGRRYRETILAPGGSRPPDELLRTFLGREPNSDAFFQDLSV